MNESIPEQKRALRESLRQAAEHMTASDRARASDAIADRVLQLREWFAAETILLYVSTPREPETSAIIGAALDSGKLVTLPRHEKDSGQYHPAIVAVPEHDLEPGRFGILEPKASCGSVSWTEVNLVLVPGVGFDREGYRLGHGGGFYDRMLGKIPGRKIGLAFDCQLVKTLPREPHDQRLDAVITPGGLLTFS